MPDHQLTPEQREVMKSVTLFRHSSDKGTGYDKDCEAIEAFPVDRRPRTHSQQRFGRLSSSGQERTSCRRPYIDGTLFGKYHLLCAMIVDSSGHKRVLGLCKATTKNFKVATTILIKNLPDEVWMYFSRRLFMTIPRRQKIDTPHFWSCSCQNFKWFAPQSMYRLASRRCLTSVDRWSGCSTLMGSSWR